MSEEEELLKAGWLRKKMKTKWKTCWYVLNLVDINNATLAHYEHKTMQRPRENDEAIDKLPQGARQIIPLAKITGLKHDEGSPEFTLDLATGVEVVLKARNPQEAMTWVKLLNLGFEKLADEHEKKYAARNPAPKEAKRKPKGKKLPEGVYEEYKSRKLQNTLRVKKKIKEKATPRGRLTEVYDNLPGPPTKEEEPKNGFESVVANLVPKKPPPPPEGEYSELTPAPAPAPRSTRKGHVGSAIVKKQKEHLEKLGVLGRNAVLPVLVVSEADKIAQSGNTKTTAVEQLLRETLERSKSLTSLLFKDLDAEAVDKMIQDMYRVEVKEGEKVVKQGESGHIFYIVEIGYFHVLHLAQYTDEKLQMVKGEESVVAPRGPRAFFGEMALLYEHPSTVTVKAVRDGVLWAISRKQFHEITKLSATRQQEVKMRKLHGIEMVTEMLTEKDIVALADAMETKTYKAGQVILDKGVAVQSVFFVKAGRVGLYGQTDAAEPEEELDDTVNSSYGALSLLEEFNSSHTLKALSANTTVLCLSIKDVEGIVGSMRENLLKKFEADPDFKTKIMSGIATFKENLEEITPEAAVKMTIAHFQKQTVRVGTGTLELDPERSQVGTEKFGGTHAEGRVKGTEGPLPALDKDWLNAPAILPKIKFSDLKPIQILGSGNFGHVHLVKNKNSSLVVELDGAKMKAPKQFALKVLSRDTIVVNGWEQMAMNEKCAMEELSYYTKSPFIVKLYHSFTDTRNIYFLLELCDYGDLYGHVKRRPGKRFTEAVMRFYVAGVVKGLEAMHNRSIIYRDLKPENLMLDSSGYLKIGDFGLAKKTLRTFTVCGTPDYMAPETILSKGHDKGVDWWAVGVLIYEIGTGHTPFVGQEPMDIYEAVLAHRELELPEGMYQGEDITANCFDLMDLLLQRKKAKRLGNLKEGAQGVIDHPWFHGFKWDDYVKRKVKAPAPKKHHNYKERGVYDPEFDAEEEDTSGWDPEVNTYLDETPTYL